MWLVDKCAAVPKKKTTMIEHVLHCSLLARGEFSKGP